MNGVYHYDFDCNLSISAVCFYLNRFAGRFWSRSHLFRRFFLRFRCLRFLKLNDVVAYNEMVMLCKGHIRMQDFFYAFSRFSCIAFNIRFSCLNPSIGCFVLFSLVSFVCVCVLCNPPYRCRSVFSFRGWFYDQVTEFYCGYLTFEVKWISKTLEMANLRRIINAVSVKEFFMLWFGTTITIKRTSGSVERMCKQNEKKKS